MYTGREAKIDRGLPQRRICRFETHHLSSSPGSSSGNICAVVDRTTVFETEYRGLPWLHHSASKHVSLSGLSIRTCLHRLERRTTTVFNAGVMFLLSLEFLARILVPNIASIIPRVAHIHFLCCHAPNRLMQVLSTLRYRRLPRNELPCHG